MRPPILRSPAPIACESSSTRCLPRWGVGCEVRVLDVYRKDALDRLERAAEVRRATFAIARTPDQQLQLGQSAGMKAAAALINSSGGNRVQIEVAMGYERGSLNDTVRGWLRTASHLGEFVTTATAEIRDDEGDPLELVNLLEYRQRSKITVEESAGGKGFDRADCLRKVTHTLIEYLQH